MGKLVNLLKRVLPMVLVGLLIFGVAPAGAQQSGGSGLSISPTLFQYTLKPGQTTTLQITLKNVTLGAVTAQAFVNDFVSDGSSGNPKILTQPGVSSPNSIKNFVFDLRDVPLDRGQQKTVKVSLNIPNGTPPGAYYGVIRYKAVPSGKNAPAPGQVALTASVGTVVLVTVPGNLQEQVQLSAIHVYRGTRDSSVFFGKPDHVGIEIDNLGNGFERPFGTVQVQNMFGKNVDSYQFNNPKQLGNVLPKSTRIFTNPVSGVNQFGRYTITVNASYGDGSHILTLKKTFWYVPLWLAIAVIVILLALILLTARLYLRHRHGSRHSYRR